MIDHWLLSFSGSNRGGQQQSARIVCSGLRGSDLWRRRGGLLMTPVLTQAVAAFEKVVEFVGQAVDHSIGILTLRGRGQVWAANFDPALRRKVIHGPTLLIEMQVHMHPNDLVAPGEDHSELVADSLLHTWRQFDVDALHEKFVGINRGVHVDDRPAVRPFVRPNGKMRNYPTGQGRPAEGHGPTGSGCVFLILGPVPSRKQ
jgi:hypothetical protein